MEDSYLVADGVSLEFASGVRALEGFNLTIRTGDFLSIVGPSGCGKSTFLRLVAGLLKPTSGTVTGGGVDGFAARKRERRIAFVFQQPTLLPWRTVERNVCLPLELRGGWNRQTRGKVAEVLELVGLSEFARAYPHELSGGMQMRASLARALVTDPDLLLLDEPFAALDDITRQRLNSELLSLWERVRFTALFVTHNVGEAVYLSHRVAVMSARPGRLVADHAIPFTFPRQAEIRSTPDFAALVGRVATSLGEASQ
ncbi:MAG: ABC transporter ATP-binding protein [Candidatus Sumerlaeia bacterium]|nr:ABC transporter ATP-binding protein [Candidatus Sumerlaeia bacterium]